MTSAAVASNIEVQGSNPCRDCPVCEIFRMAKTDDSYVKIPTKADQNDEKYVRALIGFGEVKVVRCLTGHATGGGHLGVTVFATGGHTKNFPNFL